MPALSLSVIIPNYNHAGYIGECLDALLQQSQLPLEVLVVDDGSTDNSVAVIEAYGRQNKTIRLLMHEKNRGFFHAVESGLAQALGEYVYVHSADDRVLPGFLEQSLKLLAEYPRAGLCCSDPASFADAQSPLRVAPLGWSDAPCYLPPDQLAETIRGQAVAGHTSIVRLSALRDAGGYRCELKWHSDWFAMLVVAFRHGICYVPEALAAIRVRSDSYSAAGRRNWVQQREVLCRLLHLISTPEYRDVAPYFARGSVFSHFQDEIVRAALTDPSLWKPETLIMIQEPLQSWCRDLRRHIDSNQQSIRRPTAADPIELDRVQKVVVFGAGKYGRRALELAARCGWEVLHFVDNDRALWNTRFENHRVLSVEALRQSDADLIIVGSIAHKPQIFDQLNAMGFHYRKDFIHFLDPVSIGSIDIQLSLSETDGGS
jgi:glycosyltransferase involved in cell wall biosynthesis